MNRLLLFLISISCLSSCSNTASKDSSDDASENGRVTNTRLLDTALSFSGIWVNEAYLSKLKATQSPRLSQNIMNSYIIIPRRTLEVTRMIHGFHEGGGDMIVERNGDNYTLCDLVSNKTEDSIKIISATQLKIGGQYFTRLIHQDTTMRNLGILEEILFKGHYRMANGNLVDFMEDGTVIGLDSFKVYFPVIDYTTDAKDVDHIQLGQSMLKLQDFGFLFNKDTLRIYKTRCLNYDSTSHMCEKEVLSDQVYELIRLEKR
jgi:hypothetical protein